MLSFSKGLARADIVAIHLLRQFRLEENTQLLVNVWARCDSPLKSLVINQLA